MAAACYASPERIYVKQKFANGQSFADPWPWEDRVDARPRNGNVLLGFEEQSLEAQIRQLEKAGALIAAEIDRLLRTVNS